MTAFVCRFRRLILAILVLSVTVIGFELWRDVKFGLSLDEPLSLSPPGRIDRTIDIRVDAPYELQLIFEYGSHPRLDLQRLVDDKGRREGKLKGATNVGIPLRWSLADTTGRSLWSGEADTHGASGWSDAQVYRHVAVSDRLPAGTYRLVAAVTRDVPAFDGVSVRLQLDLPNSKASYGWQSDVAFFGGLITGLVIKPLIGLLTLVFIGLGLRDGGRCR